MRENRNHRLKVYLSIIICFVSTASLMAQIKGKVIDEEGKGLPGVSVVEKGTINGTITDINGNYQINLKDKETARLVFSILGFFNQEITVNNRSEINISMQKGIAAIDEVVVVGYGTQTRREVTSSISSISNLDDRGGANIGQVLQGKAAGLQVTNTDATPGAPMRITVRGTNSINAGVEPLWIIDGVPVESEQANSEIRSSAGVMDVHNPLAYLNIDDIESIEVLKDAASTSIYGSRGANGVILVTTKQGKAGIANVRFNYEQGILEAVNYKTYLNTGQHYEMIDEMGANSNRDVSGFIPNFFLNNDPKYDFYTREYAEGIDNNWLDIVLRTGRYNKLTSSVSGGNEGTKYYVSVFKKHDEGVIVGDERNDYGLTSNVQFDISKKLTTKVIGRFGYNDNQRAQKAGSVANNDIGLQNRGGSAGWKSINRSSVPMIPIYTPDGEYFDIYGGYNPYPSMNGGFQYNGGKEYLANLVLDVNYKLSKNLQISAKGAYSNSTRSQLYYIDKSIRLKSADNPVGSSRGIQRALINRNYTANGFVQYNKRLKDFKFDVMAGTELFEKYSEIQVSDYEDLQSQKVSLGNTAAATFIQGRYSDYSNLFLSVFSRINTSYKGKYLLGLSARRDGSSLFAPSNRWGDFAAVSGGWIISDEAFFQNVEMINMLKLRSSFGSTGNASIPAFKWLNTFSTFPEYGEDAALTMGNLATDNLTWERSYTFDLALEFDLLKNRLNGSVGYYRTRTEDMLLETPVALSLGIYSENSGPTAMVNIGQMYNKGIEFQLNSVNINSPKFKWETNINFSTNKNKVGQLAQGVQSPLQIGFSPAFGNTLQLNSVWTDKRLGRYYIAEYAGLDNEGFETIYEIDRPLFESSNGQITQKTGNIIRATAQNIQTNRIYHDNKTGLPTYFGGFFNSFLVSNFTLDVGFVFSGGNYIYDQTVDQNGLVFRGNNPIDSRIYGNTFIPGVRENTKYPVQTWQNQDYEGNQLGVQHTGHLHRGDFIRLQNMSLSYNLPQEWLKSVKIRSAKIYCNMNNLFVWSPFKSFDPEFVNYGDIHAVTSDRNIGQGYIQYDPFPKARTFTMGVNLNL